MPTISPARIARTLARAALPFEEHVEDPRNPQGLRHPHRGMLNLVVVALAATEATLRQTEDLSADMSPRVRRRLGLKCKVSDTALYEVLREQSPEGFRDVLWDQVKSGLKSKAITNDAFAGGVLSFDGKGAGSGLGEAPNASCRTTVCDKQGTAVWHLYSYRAVLTSSSANPCLDQAFLPNKTGEATAFAPMMERACTAFPRLFQYVTADAEMTSAKNARFVTSKSKTYVFALKKNRRRLYDLAISALAGAPLQASSTERYQGGEVVRELRRVPCPPETNFPGASQFWAVRRIQTKRSGDVEVEQRLFITSATPEQLSPTRSLKLVRLHWGIENGANWTADMILREDTTCPCKQGNGILSITWLRLLAYNLLAVFRAHLPHKAGQPQSWRRATKLIYQVLLGVALAPPPPAGALPQTNV